MESIRMTEENGSDRAPPPAAPRGGDHWVMGKTKAQLMVDLKLYLGRLRDDPRSITDRLRVAAIQLRLGRIDEAMIHYEGVLGGYISSNQPVSASPATRWAPMPTPLPSTPQHKW